MYPFMQGQYYRPQLLKGRPVSCLDEVRGSQIDMDGTITYFPCPSENKIYTKQIDMNGCPIVICYKPEDNKQPKDDIIQTTNKLNGSVEQLQNKVIELEKMVKELRNREPYGNSDTTTTVPKPARSAAEPSWEQPYVG